MLEFARLHGFIAELEQLALELGQRDPLRVVGFFRFGEGGGGGKRPFQPIIQRRQLPRPALLIDEKLVFHVEKRPNDGRQASKLAKVVPHHLGWRVVGRQDFARRVPQAGLRLLLQQNLAVFNEYAVHSGAEGDRFRGYRNRIAIDIVTNSGGHESEGLFGNGEREKMFFQLGDMVGQRAKHAVDEARCAV